MVLLSTYFLLTAIIAIGFAEEASQVQGTAKPALHDDDDDAGVISQLSKFPCVNRFLDRFYVCNENHNNFWQLADADAAARQKQASLFARCVVDLTSDFASCSDNSLEQLDAIVETIKSKAKQVRLPESLIQRHYLPTQITDVSLWLCSVHCIHACTCVCLLS
eukprot:m.171567 g.171567  ORF g.171567 m.171567 type:complete len:163 (+) comp14553_c0_seq2:79-567(+)